VNLVAAATFVLFIGVTLAITGWAARRTRSTADFYAAGSRFTGFQNGLAIAGDFMSAATFLGITGLVFLAGFDASIYVLSPMVGLCLLLTLLAEPFRRLGRFTVSDVAAYRFRARSIRTFSAVTSLAIVILYLVSQMVGAGALIELLFRIPYDSSVILIGALMIVYVTAGGMMATTWIQIIKAILMLAAMTVLAAGTLRSFGFDLGRMYGEAVSTHRLGTQILAPGGLLEDPLSTVSLALALVFGFVGLPHIVMRLYTVPNARAAYQSVLYAGFCIGYVFILVFFVIGYGAIVRLEGEPEILDTNGALIGGTNMVAVHLARIVGGDLFLGFISSMVLATILAVVAGLTLAGASALSHDLFGQALKQGRAGETEELRVTRIATILLGVMAVLLAIVFEGQNIAYMASMVFAISASANFPLLILAVYWRNLTSRGALAGGMLGLLSSVLLMVTGPTVWVDILENESPLFPYKYPALFSMTGCFLATWLVSALDRSGSGEADRARFDELSAALHRGESRIDKRPEGGPP
jgi:cation/acetate symporter